MKTTIIIISALLGIATSSFAADITGTASTRTLTKYAAINGFMLHDGTVQQTDFFAQHVSGVYADTWVSLPWNGKNNMGKEIDWTIGWSGSVFGSGLTADIGISYFDYINLFESASDVINPYAKISYDIALNKEHSLTPYIKIEDPLPIKDGINGMYLTAGIKHTWTMSEKISFTQDLYALRDSGAYGLEKGFIAKYNLCISLKVAPSASIDTSLSVFAPLSRFTDRKNEFIPGMGFTWNY